MKKFGWQVRFDAADPVLAQTPPGAHWAEVLAGGRAQLLLRRGRGCAHTLRGGGQLLHLSVSRILKNHGNILKNLEKVEKS